MFRHSLWLSLVATTVLACGSKETSEKKAPEPPPAGSGSAAAPTAEYPVLVPLAEGTPAPDFTQVDHKGATVALKDLKGKPVVLYFYPADFGPNCTKEAEGFTEDIAEFQTAGATIIGVSRNDMKSHNEFATAKNIPYSLLSDPDGKLAATYGVGIMPNGKLWRVTFVIDKEGVIKKVYSGEGFVKNVVGHSDAVLGDVKTL